MIKLTKIKESDTPNFKSGDWQNFIPGTDNPGVSLPIEYTIKGHLAFALQVGNPITVNRTERNGVAVAGTFISSPIVKIVIEKDTTKLETTNSVYLLENI